MPKQNLFIIALVLLLFKVNAQTKILTIDEVNEIALNQSNRVKMINNDFTKSKIESSFYRISLLPSIASSISFPYQRSISEVIQSDGSQRFIERNYLNSALNLTISQVLPFTGGSISLTSSLNNARNFNNKTSSFSSNWANISYQQTINGYNSYKWNKKLNALNIKKDSINYIKDKIKLKYDVSKMYLDTQLLQLKYVLIKKNIEKTQSLLFELEEKLKFGRTIKIEVEQTKITLEQLNRQLEINELDYNLGIQAIKNVMNDKSIDLFLLTGVNKSDFILIKEILIESIKKNGLDLEKELKMLEIDSNVEKVKKEGAISLNFQLGMGLNSSADRFLDLYDTPTQSQFLTFGSKIPILDWSKAKKKYSLAKLEKVNLELEILNEEIKIQEQVDEIFNYKFLLITQIKSFEKQLLISKEITKMYEELLKLGRKTIAEYRTQITEEYNITIELQKAVNNLYLLKLKVDEFNLIF